MQRVCEACQDCRRLERKNLLNMAQEWPPKLCQKIVDGVNETFRSSHSAVFTAHSAFPVTCDACVRRVRANGQGHTRVVGEGNCPADITDTAGTMSTRPTSHLPCEGCRKRKASSDPLHIKIPGKCVVCANTRRPRCECPWTSGATIQFGKC